MYRISSNRRPGVLFPSRLCGPGVYLLHVFLAYAHPRYVAHAEVEIQVHATVWLAKWATGTLNSFLLEGHVEALFCAVGVAVGEVQLSPLSLPRDARGLRTTPPRWYRVDPASNRGPALNCYTASV